MFLKMFGRYHLPTSWNESISVCVKYFSINCVQAFNSSCIFVKKHFHLVTSLSFSNISFIRLFGIQYTMALKLNEMFDT